MGRGGEQRKKGVGYMQFPLLTVPQSWQGPMHFHYRDSKITMAIIAISILSLSTTYLLSNLGATHCVPMLPLCALLHTVTMESWWARIADGYGCAEWHVYPYYRSALLISYLILAPLTVFQCYHCVHYYTLSPWNPDGPGLQMDMDVQNGMFGRGMKLHRSGH